MTEGGVRRACSLRAVLASRSPAAVIFRRGPSKLTGLILWDRDADTFQVGQWFKGSVYPERSALSPDGTHLLTFLGKFRGPFGTYTVLSRPPFYTALALWPKGDTWGGGGEFLDDRTIVLHHHGAEHVLAPGYAMPAGFTLVPPGPGRDELVRRARDRDPPAWRAEEGPDRTYATRTFSRHAPDGAVLRTHWHADDPNRRWAGEHRTALVVGDRWTRLAGAPWADFDRNGDLLFAIEGCLHRCPAWALRGAASLADLLGAGRVLADFTDLAFQALPAPYRAFSPSADDPEASPADAEPDGFSPALDRVTREERRHRKRQRSLARARPPRSL